MRRAPFLPPAPLVWLDLEMTGLDPDRCVIVQLAIVLTDVELRDVAEPLELTIWQPDVVLERMEPFVRRMHEKSGLLDAVRKSRVSLADAENQALQLVSTHAPFQTARLCGNSIHQDRRFLTAYMPSLEHYLHYRQIDVTTVKELGFWWNGLTWPKPQDAAHTALFDVRQSIAELRHYREHLWRPK